MNPANLHELQHDASPRTATGDEQRTYLAGERTLLAWIRTSLALMGFGFIVAKFGLFLREILALRAEQNSQELEATLPSTGWSLWIGVGLVLLGVFVNVVSAREHIYFLHQFDCTELARPRRYITQMVMLAIITFLGVLMAVYLVLVGS